MQQRACHTSMVKPTNTSTARRVRRSQEDLTRAKPRPKTELDRKFQNMAQQERRWYRASNVLEAAPI